MCENFLAQATVLRALAPLAQQAGQNQRSFSYYTFQSYFNRVF
jgi:hypothetical protein